MKRLNGIARLRRVMCAGFVLAGAYMFIIVAPVLISGDKREPRFEAWLTLGMATVLLIGGVVELFKKR